LGANPAALCGYGNFPLDFGKMTQKSDNLFLGQILPTGLTVVVFAGLTAAVFFVIKILNLFYPQNPVSLSFHSGDVLAGAVIYFKTAIDFVILMGFLMASNPGWKKRISIELGTALGNALGTILILVIWIVFKELRVLLAIMIVISALVLFELADESLDHFHNWQHEAGVKKTLFLILQKFLGAVLKVIRPLTSKIVPNFGAKLKGEHKLPFGKLLIFSLSVPFLLGLDNFAGYVPLFSIVNVWGFTIGVLAAHTLLNIALFLNPYATVKLVKNQWIAFFGSAAFVLLAVWGIIEAVQIFV
jgi:cadmium resistance protein CadD (predicted permease)